MPAQRTPAEDVVGIHPHKAATLASELRHTARLLFDHSTATFDALARGLEDASQAIALFDGTEWFGAQARELQHVIDDVVRTLVDPTVPLPAGIQVWRQPYATSFDNPSAAVAAAEQAGTLLAGTLLGSAPDADADDRLVWLFSTWQGNEAFAVAFARTLSPGDVADLLRLEAEWRRGGAGPAGAGGSRAREGVFVALATASTSGLLGFAFGDLVRKLRDDEGAPLTAARARELDPLGFLFPTSARWDPQVLLDAVHQYLIPVNRTGGEQTVTASVGGTDPRVGLLLAVSRDPYAATQMLGEPQAFDDLFAARYGYGDGGRALAELLRTGTDPASDTPAADLRGREPDPRAQNMMRFVRWVLDHQELPPVTRELLGGVTAPWIASFRAPARDADPTMGNPLAALDDDTRLRYLDYVADDLVALRDLRLREVAWVRHALLRVGGAGFDGSGVGLVANIDRRTSRAVRDGMVRTMEREDDRINFDKQVWGFVASLLVYPLRSGVDVAADTITHGLGETFRPDSDMALDYARTFPSLAASDDHKLQQSLLVALWNQREQNHVFDDVAPPPAAIVAGEPPHLLEVADMTPADHDAWIAWIDDAQLRRRAHWDQLTVGADG